MKPTKQGASPTTDTLRDGCLVDQSHWLGGLRLEPGHPFASVGEGVQSVGNPAGAEVELARWCKSMGMCLHQQPLWHSLTFETNPWGFTWVVHVGGGVGIQSKAGSVGHKYKGTHDNPDWSWFSCWDLERGYFWSQESGLYAEVPN